MSLKEVKNSEILVGIHIRNLSQEMLISECLHSLALQNRPVDVLITYNGLKKQEVKKLEEIAKEPKRIIVERDPEDPEKTITKEESAGGSLNFLIEETESENFSDVFNHVFQTAKEHSYSAFSLVEQEDIISIRWYELAEQYAEENSDVAIFLPLVKNMTNGSFQGFLNEACWAEGWAEEAGKYDNQLLLRFNFVAQPLGGYYIVDRILEQEDGFESREDKWYPMKRSIKLFNYYEFFLRSAYNDLKIMNIPRIGYELRTTREQVESYDPISCKIPTNLPHIPEDKGGMSQGEAQYWAKYATDAYFMEDDDPEAKYEPEN